MKIWLHTLNTCSKTSKIYQTTQKEKDIEELVLVWCLHDIYDCYPEVSFLPLISSFVKDTWKRRQCCWKEPRISIYIYENDNFQHFNGIMVNRFTNFFCFFFLHLLTHKNTINHADFESTDPYPTVFIGKDAIRQESLWSSPLKPPTLLSYTASLQLLFMNDVILLVWELNFIKIILHVDSINVCVRLSLASSRIQILLIPINI